MRISASPILLRSLNVIGAMVAPRSTDVEVANRLRIDDDILIKCAPSLSNMCPLDEHARRLWYLHILTCGLEKENSSPSCKSKMRSHIQGILLPARRPWVRSLVLFVMLLLSIALYVRLIVAAPQRDDLINPFLEVWMICFLPYFGACAFILLTKPLMGRWFWIELGIILAGALIF